MNRFLNVVYGEMKAEIDTKDMRRISQVQKEVKAAFPQITFGYPQIQFYDKENNQFDDLDDIPAAYYKKRKEGGLELVIKLLPSPHPSETNLFNGNYSLITDHRPFKKQRTEISDLTRQLKSFVNCHISDDCIIEAPSREFLPYPQEKIQKLYVRKCYQDVFDLLMEQIGIGMESFAISGTPGIGKSLFFIYILYRMVKAFPMKTLPLKSNRILLQMGSTYQCFDLHNQIVTKHSELEAVDLVREQDTFYVIDGQSSLPLVSSCIVLFISSPRSEYYKQFTKQSKAVKWYFPVWTLDALEKCQNYCYPNLSIDTLKKRHLIYGGVARYIFDIRSDAMEEALADVNAVKGVRNIGIPTGIFATSHTLLHMIVSSDDLYKFLYVDIASKYVGEQLWIRHSAQMVTSLQEMFGGSPNEISRHLFEIYGHLVFSNGGKTLKCRCLDDGIVTEIVLDALPGDRVTFGKSTIPTAKDLVGTYYEPTDEDNFPAVDSLSSQGMFQFTVAAEHPIRGVDILRKLCSLYDDPKLYFVVPPHRFKNFKKQSFKAKKGASDVSTIPELKQYVLELSVI